MRWFMDTYLADPADRTTTTVSAFGRLQPISKDYLRRSSSSTRTTFYEIKVRRTANKFREAGVPVTSVRFNGTMHDFMMLKNALRDTESTHAAVGLAVTALRHAFDSVSVA